MFVLLTTYFFLLYCHFWSVFVLKRARRSVLRLVVIWMMCGPNLFFRYMGLPLIMCSK